MKFRKAALFLSLLVAMVGVSYFSSAISNNVKDNEEIKLVLKKKKNGFITYSDNDTSSSIIISVAVVGITITGAYIYLMKGNDKK